MSITLSLGPRVRKSPYFEAARKAGLAAASVYNHMYCRRAMAILPPNMTGW